MGDVTEPLSLMLSGKKTGRGYRACVGYREYTMKKFQSAMTTEAKDLRMWKKVQAAICFFPSFKYKVQ